MHFTGEKAVVCESCGMVFLSPRMTVTELTDFYEKNEFSEKFRGSPIPTPDLIAQREVRADKKIELIKKYLPLLPGGPVLEIGCSSGYFIRRLQKCGYDVYGIDPSRGFVQFAREEYGLNVVSGMFPDDLPNDWGNNYSMIAAFHVLEHTDDPKRVLNSIYNSLKNEGLLFLEVPDIDRVLRTRKYLHKNYFQKSHIWDFSAATIKILLESCGFNTYVCLHYGISPPEDKNVFIVAGKGNKNFKPLSKTVVVQTSNARRLYLRLRWKLLLGQVVNALDARRKRV